MVSAQPSIGPCHPVAEAQWFLQRTAFLEQRCMEILAAWIWTTGDQDCKLEFGAHAWQDSVHADYLLLRSGELRPSLPPYGRQPGLPDPAALDAVCRELAQAPSLGCKLSGLYGALKPWLLACYEHYYAQADPILEAPTMLILEQIILTERRQIAWGQATLEQRLAAAPEALAEAASWQMRLERQLSEAHPATSTDAAGASPLPLLSFSPGDPASDPRLHLVFHTAGLGPSEEVEFDPQSETEIQQIMLSTLVAVETEAAELLGRLLVEFPDLPWEMRRQLCRQMWDECRHAASQWRVLEHLGAHLGDFPSIAYINRMVGDEPDVFKRLIVLQRVVEGISVDQHRPRGRYFQQEGMWPLVNMFDYVLADEDTHIAFSRWINILVGHDAQHLDELARYQAQKEQEFADFTDWLVSKRRDLARLYAAPQRAPVR